MPIITIRDAQSGAEARIFSEMGFNCFEFRAPVAGRMVEVLDAEPDFTGGNSPPSRSGIPLLFPFPNRIRGAKYSWEGREYHLTGVRDDKQGNAIHGFVIDRPWRITAQKAECVTGEFQLSRDAPDRRPLWPADFIIEVRYGIKGSAMRCDIRIANADRVPLPWGFGTHSYFRVPLAPESTIADCLVQAPASQMWELINCLPTGKRVAVSAAADLREGKLLSGLKLDDVLTGVTARDGAIESRVVDAKAGLQVTQFTDAIFRELVAFTPAHGRSVCLEPYTCVTDAMNLEPQGINAGLQVLPPGGEIRTWFEFHVGQVVV